MTAPSPAVATPTALTGNDAAKGTWHGLTRVQWIVLGIGVGLVFALVFIGLFPGAAVDTIDMTAWDAMLIARGSIVLALVVYLLVSETARRMIPELVIAFVLAVGIASGILAVTKPDPVAVEPARVSIRLPARHVQAPAEVLEAGQDVTIVFLSPHPTASGGSAGLDQRTVAGKLLGTVDGKPKPGSDVWVTVERGTDDADAAEALRAAASAVQIHLLPQR